MKDGAGIKLFTFSGLFFLGFLWLSLILAFFGFFHAWILGCLATLALIFLFYFIYVRRRDFLFKKDFLAVSAGIILAVSIFSFFSEPSVFSGRDQGSLSLSAIALAKNHTLTFSFTAQKEFFHIYGAGTALNFPGFNYNPNGDLVSHFPPGYIVYLASFYSFFGLSGFILANALAFVFFLFSFYLLSLNYLKTSSALMTFSLILTSFIFSWIFKFTLSENLALALIWFALAQLLLFLKNSNKLHLSAHLLSFGFLIFVRIETLAFLAISLFILYRRSAGLKKFMFKTLGAANLIFLGLIFSFFLLSLQLNSAFYITFAKGFFNSFDSISGETDPAPYPLASFFYVLRVFLAYALLPYLVLGTVSFIYFFKKKKFETLIPFFILLPAFFYILSPSITLDHPWMLRRYVFAVIPVSVLYTMIFLETFIRKNKYFFLFSFFLLLTNLLVFIPYLSVRENDNLLEETTKLQDKFQKNDLILIDRDATGDPWAMISGPFNLLFEKQAVYFFNPLDLEKIETEKFDHVYLIVADENLNLYAQGGFLNRFKPVENYTLVKKNLDILSEKKTELLKKSVFLPPYQKNYVYGKIYLLKK